MKLTSSQYYIHTKDILPMDIDFVIQDTYALTRPQWKVAGNLEEAGQAFATAVAQNYKIQEAEKIIESEEADDDGSSGEGPEEDELRALEMNHADSSDEEVEAEVVFVIFFPSDFAYSRLRRCLAATLRPIRILRTSLLLASSKSVILKPKPISTESLQR